MATLSLAEAITASFYAWEVRGRGWTLADYPVALEPPYRPFFLLPEHAQSVGVARIDDGYRPTIASRLVDGIRNIFSSDASENSVTKSNAGLPFVEEASYPAPSREPRIALRIRLPTDLEVDHDLSERLILMLASSEEPLSFELVGTAGQVECQIVTTRADVPRITEILRAYLPEVDVAVADDLVPETWASDGWRGVLDIGLSEEFFLPLRVDRSPPIDLYAPLVAAMARCARGELLALQVMVEQVRNPWAKSIKEALDDGNGSCILDDAPEFPKLAEEKVCSPLLAVCMRFGVFAATEERLLELARSTEGFLAQFARPTGNALVPLTSDGYDEAQHAQDFIDRTSCRTGMILSTEEVAGFAHIPTAILTHPALVRTAQRSRPTPQVAQGHVLVLGEILHRDERISVTLSTEARFAHTHVIGSTGTGKSTLLTNLIIQDIARGDGVAVFDPHGDLIDDILARMPEERTNDVILFDPSDEEFPIGFGFFTAKSDVERTLIASDTVAVFERLATSWGDSMNAVLGNAVYAMLASPEPATLLDLRRFLIDEGFRKEFLARITDPEVRFYWEAQFPLIGTRSIGPILTRLDGFLRPRIVRNIVGQREPRLSIPEVLDGRKVLLARLPHGLIGAENAALLGSLLVTKIHQSALARQRLPGSERTPFFCYLDEFQHFVTPSIASLVSEGRKYRIGLTIAHQSLAQLTIPAVESAVLSNMYTRIVFRTGDAVAKRLAEGFAHFETSDIQALGRGEMIVRMGSAGDDCLVMGFPPRSTSNDDETVARIKRVSRERYAIPRTDLEVTARVEADRRTSGAVPERRGPDHTPASEVASMLSTPEASEPRQEATVSRAPIRPRPPAAPAELGKGGQEHRYLQHLVKRLAEERGFRAVIEEDIGEGRSVDVLLRQDSLTVACEISVTTEIDHELANMVKCAAKGYSRILFISASKRKRDQMLRRAAEVIPGAPLVAVPPEEIVAVLESFELGNAPTESTLRGYKVKVKRQAVSPQDVTNRRSAVAEVIARSLAKGSKG